MRRKSIKGLKWAKLLDAQPTFVPDNGVYTKVQRAGLLYEKKVGDYLEALYGKYLLKGPWFEFEDSRGKGYCQPDFILKLKKEVVIIECKLTARNSAEGKLRNVYQVVVKEALSTSLPIKMIQICKSLKLGFQGPVGKDVKNLKPLPDYSTVVIRRPA